MQLSSFLVGFCALSFLKDTPHTLSRMSCRAWCLCVAHHRVGYTLVLYVQGRKTAATGRGATLGAGHVEPRLACLRTRTDSRQGWHEGGARRLLLSLVAAGACMGLPSVGRRAGPLARLPRVGAGCWAHRMSGAQVAWRRRRSCTPACRSSCAYYCAAHCHCTTHMRLAHRRARAGWRESAPCCLAPSEGTRVLFLRDSFGGKARVFLLLFRTAAGCEPHAISHGPQSARAAATCWKAATAGILLVESVRRGEQGQRDML